MVKRATQLANILRPNIQLLKAFLTKKCHLCHFQFSLDFYFCPLKTFLMIANYLRNGTKLVIISVALAILIFLPEKLSEYLLCNKWCLLINPNEFFSFIGSLDILFQLKW